MVAANKSLLKEVGKLAIKEELLAMRLRGIVVVAVMPPPVKKAHCKNPPLT